MSGGGLRKVIIIDASPHVIFKALTDPEELAKWFSEEAKIKAEKGGRFEFRARFGSSKLDSKIHSRITEIVPDRILSYTWEQKTGSGYSPMTVTWTLDSLPSGKTSVTLVHSSIPEGIRDEVERSWSLFLGQLDKLCAAKAIPAEPHQSVPIDTVKKQTTTSVGYSITKPATAFAIAVIVVAAAFAVVLYQTNISGTASTKQPSSTTASPPNGSCNILAWNESSSSDPTDSTLQSYMQHAPVLLMRPNSTGSVCVVYQTAWQGNQSRWVAGGQVYLPEYEINGNIPLAEYFTPMNWKCLSWNAAESCIEGTSYFPHSLVVSSAPAVFRPSANVDYFTVVYTVRALSNSTGFYDQTAPWVGCTVMPMAVGYSAASMNGSDFGDKGLPPDQQRAYDGSCSHEPILAFAEYVAGMNVSYVNLQVG